MTRFLGFAILALGLVLLGLAWNSYSWRQGLVGDDASVRATIVDVHATTDSDGDPSYQPIYEYRVGGDTYRHQPSVSTGEQPQVGASQTLYVDPDDPDRAFADTFDDRWFSTVMFAGFGLGATAVGCSILMFERRRRRGLDDTPGTIAMTSNDVLVRGDAAADHRGPFL